MDPGIGIVPGLLCGCDGSHGLPPALTVWPQVAFHGRVLWIYHHDIHFRSQSESLSISCLPLCAANAPLPNYCIHQAGRADTSVLRARVATQYIPHPDLGYHTDRLPFMVPDQLLSHGIQRSANSYYLWGQEGSCVDDRVRLRCSLQKKGVLRDMGLESRRDSETRTRARGGDTERQSVSPAICQLVGCIVIIRQRCRSR